MSIPAYRAVMRCPSCRSEHTQLTVIPSKVLRDGTPIDVEVKWVCQVCKRVFSPPSGPSDREREPVLMCSRCQAPSRHRYEGTRERTWREPSHANAQAARIFVEIYFCSACGESREYGIAPLQVEQMAGPAPAPAASPSAERVSTKGAR